MTVVVAFALLLALGLPVAFVLIAATFAFVGATGNLRLLESLPQILFNSIEVFDLLAIPLFILLGELMNEGGITRRIVLAARAWLGWVPHSMAYVSLSANLLLASIMGSATAQIAVMSRVMVPEMERDGYSRTFAAALTASAGLLGPIIPPSMIFIIYGVVGQVSIKDMFIGGILPGLLLAALLCAVIAFGAARAHDGRTARAERPDLWKATGGALLTLSIPAVIVGGIAFGIVTPTESAAVATLLAAIIGGVVFRELKWAHLSPALERTARNTATVLFLIAAAKVFGWVLTFNQVPQSAAALLQAMTSDPTVFMVLVFVFLMIVGMVLDGIAALIVLVPILLPIAQKTYGIDPVHFGVMTCLTLTLGLLTPPVGAGLYVAAAMSGAALGRLARAILPFIAVTCAVILAVVFLPALTTALR
ncbi:TRAP transporter large permease [Azospirillum halopraeferens]|uniref:TRAP transporter large permease n=1 Tax=Azospirillum halopraeferens TaxID=34010 RepID=UPI00041661A6|nr:TRAP transporter large permease [Azospirillum halopraeferens]